MSNSQDAPGERKPTSGNEPSARERIVGTAYELFCQHGIKAVGIDRIIAESGVAKMTMYRHFSSKEALALAVLERRERRWTEDWLQVQVQQRASAPADQLLAIFDVFDGWFRQLDFEGCLFIDALLEFDDRAHPIHQASREHLGRIRRFIAQLASGAGIADPDGFARQWHILMKGSIVAAGEGDVDAARRAQAMAQLLLAVATEAR